jgi:hypothetical protein
MNNIRTIYYIIAHGITSFDYKSYVDANLKNDDENLNKDDFDSLENNNDYMNTNLTTMEIEKNNNNDYDDAFFKLQLNEGSNLIFLGGAHKMYAAKGREHALDLALDLTINHGNRDLFNQNICSDENSKNFFWIKTEYNVLSNNIKNYLHIFNNNINCIKLPEYIDKKAKITYEMQNNKLQFKLNFKKIYKNENFVPNVKLSFQKKNNENLGILCFHLSDDKTIITNFDNLYASIVTHTSNFWPFIKCLGEQKKIAKSLEYVKKKIIIWNNIIKEKINDDSEINENKTKNMNKINNLLKLIKIQNKKIEKYTKEYKDCNNVERIAEELLYKPKIYSNNIDFDKSCFQDKTTPPTPYLKQQFSDHIKNKLFDDFKIPISNSEYMTLPFVLNKIKMYNESTYNNLPFSVILITCRGNKNTEGIYGKNQSLYDLLKLF